MVSVCLSNLFEHPLNLLTFGICSKYGAIQFITKNKQVQEMRHENWDAAPRLVLTLPRDKAEPAGPQPKKDPPILLKP